jgi:hypothetical protein
LPGATAAAESHDRKESDRLVDEMLPGVEKSEKDHKLAGDRTESGEFASRL